MKTFFAIGLPLTLYALWLQGVFLLHSLQITFTFIFFIFAIIPFVFRYSYTLQRSMLFLPFVPWPREKRFSVPEKLGLPGTRNFYVKTDDGIKLGVWHIVPESKITASDDLKDDQKDEWFEEALVDGSPVVLYMHGNSGSRAGAHRVELYRVLRALGCHVIAFDYRGYGDSSSVHPCEVGVVADGIFMFEWVRHRIKDAPFIVWGHSLGTGVSSHVLDIVTNKGLEPHGLILESPFNNLRDEICEHPLAQLFRAMPWFESCFVEPFAKNNLEFVSDQHILNIKVPITILHAEDDRVVPFHLGKKLFDSALEGCEQSADNINFFAFPSGQGYGHKYICRAPELPVIIQGFIEKCTER